MKRTYFIFLLSILFLANFVFAETLLGEGETVIKTYSNDSIDSQVSTQDNINLGISILLLAIILGLFYWFASARRRQPRLTEKNTFKNKRSVKRK